MFYRHPRTENHTHKFAGTSRTTVRRGASVRSLALLQRFWDAAAPVPRARAQARHDPIVSCQPSIYQQGGSGRARRILPRASRARLAPGTPLRNTLILRDPHREAARLGELGLDRGDAVGRGGHGLGLLVGDLDVEGLLDRHDQLDGVERVRAEVLGERGTRDDGVELNAKLLRDDALD